MTAPVKPRDTGPEPCNYVAAEHQGETHRFAPGWRCVLHTPEAVHQRYAQ